MFLWNIYFAVFTFYSTYKKQVNNTEQQNNIHTLNT